MAIKNDVSPSRILLDNVLKVLQQERDMVFPVLNKTKTVGRVLLFLLLGVNSTHVAAICGTVDGRFVGKGEKIAAVENQ